MSGVCQPVATGNSLLADPPTATGTPPSRMDEIDYYSTGDAQSEADDRADEEFLGEGSLALERSPEELAQAILYDLHHLVDTYGIEDAELENLVELLKETFTVVECVPGLKDKCSALQEDRDILHGEWLKEKEKYRKRTEVGIREPVLRFSLLLPR